MDRKTLLEQAKERYSPGKGPWKKPGGLDQIDLVWLENFASHFMFYSDPRGQLSGAVELLVAEVRHARGGPTPEGEIVPCLTVD